MKSINQRPLGIFQPVWDSWKVAGTDVKKLPREHFTVALLTQVLEVYEALAVGNTTHAAEEVVDIIGVSLNWLRWLGFSDYQVGGIVQGRTQMRYLENAHKILTKYHERLGI